MTKQAILQIITRFVLFLLPFLRDQIDARLAKLADSHGKWASRRFGDEGPYAAFEYLHGLAIKGKLATAMEGGDKQSPYLRSTLGNCLLLTLDIARRQGLDASQLLAAAEEKHEANKRKEAPNE